MANLLSQKEKKRFKWEYRFRLIIIILLFCTATFSFGVVLLLPSYFVSQLKEESIVRQSELLKETIAFREIDISAATLLATKQKINALTSVQEQVPQTKIIQTIIQNIDENIVVDTFYYKKGEMKITGRADSRTALISFSNRLEKEELFNRVDLPISSLARDSDIIFSITLNGGF